MKSRISIVVFDADDLYHFLVVQIKKICIAVMFEHMHVQKLMCPFTVGSMWLCPCASSDR